MGATSFGLNPRVSTAALDRLELLDDDEAGRIEITFENVDPKLLEECGFVMPPSPELSDSGTRVKNRPYLAPI